MSTFKIIGADGREYGPVSSEQLKQWIAEGRANAQTRVLPEGALDWTLLASLPDFAAEFARPGIPPLPGVLPLRKLNPMALTGMILGLVAVTFVCCCYGFPFNVAGIVFSIVGLVQIKNDPERYSGKGMAIAGLVLSVLSILLGIGFLIFGLAMGWNDIMRDIKNF